MRMRSRTRGRVVTSTEPLTIEHLDFEATFPCTVQTEDWECPNQATHRVVPASRCEHVLEGFACGVHVPWVLNMIALRTIFRCLTCGHGLVLLRLVPL